MAETIKVELLREIKHGANGKVFKYTPAKRGEIKHTLIPIALYNALKDTTPPHFRVAKEVVVETIGAEEATTMQMPAMPTQKTNKEKVTPLEPIQYVDAEEAEEAEMETPLGIPLAEDASVAEVQAKALEAINGVGPALARNLVEAGYTTVADVALADVSDLDSIKGFSPTNINIILDSANELVN